MLGRFGRHSWDDNPGRTHFEDGLGWFIVLIRCNISRQKDMPGFSKNHEGLFPGLCWAYVGPMLGHLLGYVGFHGGLWNEKFNPNRNFRLRLFLGALGGLCQTNVGPFWKTLLGRQSWKDSLRRRSWLFHCIN